MAISTIRTAAHGDIDNMAAVAAAAQKIPGRFCPYLSESAEAMVIDIGEIVDWPAQTAVAELDGQLLGWLLAEVDDDMGRVWWWGPFVDPAVGDGDEVADQLHQVATANLGGHIDEFEACTDVHGFISDWCERHDLRPDPGSVLLSCTPRTVARHSQVRPLRPTDHPGVIELHDAAFPGTHTPGHQMISRDHPRFVYVDGDRVAGYVAVEAQPDGSGYVDFLAVQPERRGEGIGRALVEHATAELFDGGASHVHLTVRSDNAAARALYRSVGFGEVRELVPFRAGFTLV